MRACRLDFLDAASAADDVVAVDVVAVAALPSP
jgi:hypothetical protein